MIGCERPHFSQKTREYGTLHHLGAPIIWGTRHAGGTATISLSFLWVLGLLAELARGAAWGARGLRRGLIPVKLDPAMLVGDDEMRTTGADRSAGARMFVVVIDLQSFEIG